MPVFHTQLDPSYKKWRQAGKKETLSLTSPENVLRCTVLGNDGWTPKRSTWNCTFLHIIEETVPYREIFSAKESRE